MTTALLLTAAILALRSDAFRGLFYDSEGVKLDAFLLAFFVVVIFREVASEVSSKETTVRTKAPDTSTGPLEVKGEPEPETKEERIKPTPPKPITIEDLKSHAVVRVPEGLKTIDEKAFSGNKALTWVEIPSTVTEIKKEAFSGCSGLKSVTIKEGSLEVIGNAAFQGCSSLTAIKLPASLKVVDELAFCGCVELTSVDIQKGLKSMGQNSFRNCTKLTTIEIPSGCSLQFSSD